MRRVFIVDATSRRRRRRPPEWLAISSDRDEWLDMVKGIVTSRTHRRTSSSRSRTISTGSRTYSLSTTTSSLRSTSYTSSSACGDELKRTDVKMCQRVPE
eukprot:15141900-Heterocapsa_arctica.AAC.1